jgi:3-phosphoglycerate kinase
MAFTFKKTLDNVSIGNSLFDQPGSEKVHAIMEKAKKNNVKVVFPVDYVTGDKFDAKAQVGSATDAEGIPDGWMGLDAGPKSRELFRETILASKTILWNGPPGVFEFDAFAAGSKGTLDACVEACQNGATVIVGGGDTATVVASKCSSRYSSVYSHSSRTLHARRVRRGRQAQPRLYRWWCQLGTPGGQGMSTMIYHAGENNC